MENTPKSSEDVLTAATSNAVLSTSESKSKRRCRILKAADLRSSASGDEVQGVGANGDQPAIHLLRDGDAVSGVEVVCRCGEKIVLHFDQDTDGNAA